MRIRTKTLLVALTTALVLASALTAASARNFSVTNTAFRINWNPLTFSSSPRAGEGITLSCKLTLEGSFHYRTIIKQPGALIGWVTKAIVERPCGGAGSFYAANGVEEAGLGAPFPNTLPWHFTYETFTGRLPGITSIRHLLRPVINVNLTGVLCRYSGNIQLVANLGVGTFTPDPTIGMAKTSGGILCPGNGYFSAAGGETFLLGSNTTRIFISLI